MKFNKKIIPICLSGLASVGLAFTSYLSIKTTLKIRSDYIGSSKESVKDVVISNWKDYIPVGLAALGTIGCICGSCVYSHKFISSLISAYSILNTKHLLYESKVKELCGEETHEKILKEIDIEKPKEVYINVETLIGYLDNDLDSIQEEEALFYDTMSNRFFTTKKSKVLDAEMNLNRNFALGAFPTINDFYHFLGLEPIDSGNILGWTNVGGFYWLDFIHRKNQLPDGRVYYSIDPYISPSTDFLEDI